MVTHYQEFNKGIGNVIVLCYRTEEIDHVTPEALLQGIDNTLINVYQGFKTVNKNITTDFLPISAVSKYPCRVSLLGN